ncbi:hypothetical protein [Sphingosinicella sp. BN140058]|uniref:hypothetical protein n=1 Tax=Sphingosinicella sp. BN140058 TaxID=1892855 RepID=UPI0010113340|nr:hypothetical protein [Sphingosinicella sp. BN140058]QAY76418.1 hypothetical protein ETR14_07875 [Sphingosinicella sp. BN140058]
MADGGLAAGAADEGSAPKRDTRFKPGNPGKPRGARHRATQMVEASLHGELEEIVGWLIRKARWGDMQAIRLCIDRLLPRPQEAPVTFDLPPMHSPADVADAGAQVLAAVAAGEITIGEGSRLMGLLDRQVALMAAARRDAAEQEVEAASLSAQEVERLEQMSLIAASRRDAAAPEDPGFPSAPEEQRSAEADRDRPAGRDGAQEIDPPCRAEAAAAPVTRPEASGAEAEEEVIAVLHPPTMTRGADAAAVPEITRSGSAANTTEARSASGDADSALFVMAAPRSGAETWADAASLPGPDSCAPRREKARAGARCDGHAATSAPQPRQQDRPQIGSLSVDRGEMAAAAHTRATAAEHDLPPQRVADPFVPEKAAVNRRPRSRDIWIE